MTPEINPVLLLCRELLAQGQLPASRFSVRTQKALATMFDSSRLVRRRSGHGFVVVVEDVPAFQAFVDRTFKRASLPLAATTAGALNLIKWADTKGSRREGQSECMLARAFTPKVAITATGPIDIGALTSDAGVAGFRLDQGRALMIPGPLVLIENPELFWNWEAYEPTCPFTLIFKSGNASNALIEWLATGPMQEADLIVAADYDPTGIGDYLRIKRKLGERVTIPLPENLEDLFGFFANRNLLKPVKSAELLQRLRSETDASAQHVLKLIDKFRGGLEHEALLISNTPEPLP